MSEMNLRIPPHNDEAEQSVLGSMMLDSDALSVGLSMLSSESFYKPAHQKIFTAIKKVHEAGDPVDQISVVSYLNDDKELVVSGGSYYISELTEKVPSTANVKYYAREVSDAALIRAAIVESSNITAAGFDGSISPQAMLEKVNSLASKLINKNSSGYVMLEDISGDALDAVTDRFDNPNSFPGKRTGILEIDKVLGGLKGGDEIIIAANPSIGKTALALQIGRNFAADGNPVGVISLEMSKKQLYLRTLFSEASVPGDLLNYGAIQPDQYKKLLHASQDINKFPLYIDDSTDGSAGQLIAKAQHLINSKKIKLLIIDYLQLMDEPGESNRNLEIGKITRMFKQLAKKADIPVVILSQLTKDAYGRRPSLKDLRDSGAIAQDADIVIFIWRPEQHGIDLMPDGTSSSGVAIIDIAKHRNGPTADFRMSWVKEYARFESLF